MAKKKPSKKKKKSQANTQKVYKYLEEKKLACTKASIMKGTKLSLPQVNHALAGLRRRKKIGVMRSYWDHSVMSNKNHTGEL